eukprot:363673-Chlamydomonas_euryale.AAC.2
MGGRGGGRAGVHARGGACHAWGGGGRAHNTPHGLNLIQHWTPDSRRPTRATLVRRQRGRGQVAVGPKVTPDSRRPTRATLVRRQRGRGQVAVGPKVTGVGFMRASRRGSRAPRGQVWASRVHPGGPARIDCCTSSEARECTQIGP